jgi:hypothetical protein
MRPDGIDYEALAKSTEQVRECLAVMVAGLIQDGFTEKQARMIVAGMWAMDDDDEEDGE